MSIHDGHRARMKKRFLEHGLDNFDDLSTLELLLFYALPRQDTNALAHTLLARFGSLAGTLDAAPEELLAVPGLGESGASLLRLIPEVSRRYVTEKTPMDLAVDTPTMAGRFFIPRFLHEREEVILALALDARFRPLACQELSRGTVDAATIHLRRLMELTVKTKASAVILAHNHLSGSAMPSQEDVIATETARQALALLGVDLRDHVVVAGTDYVSLAESGLIRRPEKDEK